MTKKEWFDSVEDSVIVEAPPNRWGGSNLVLKNDMIFTLNIDELLGMLETSEEFYKNPTKENMIKIAKKYVESQVNVLRLDAAAYIEEAFPLFLKDELKK